MTVLSPTLAPGGRLSANLICMASMLVWSAGLPAAELVIPHIPPLPMTALRTGLAALVLLPIWWLVDGAAAVREAPWGRGIVVGGICLGLGALLLVIAQGRTDPVTVAVITATMPVVGIALECLLDGRRLTGALILGLLLGLAGGILAYGGGAAGLTLGWGAVAAFGSVLAFTWGSRATVTAFPRLTPLGRTALTVSGAAIAATLIAGTHMALGGPGPDWARLGPTEWGALSVYGIGSLAVSQILWIVAVGRLGIGVSSLHSNAVPFYVMLILLAFGQGWNWTQAGGAAIVALGVLVAQGVIRLPGRA
ncbi:MAG: DMT family transporter [Paracoccaceae bacterium]|nr:MAG: DMT family transporter [Paracoccaceae bacterium]